MIELEEKLRDIIRKKTNFSKLNFEIKLSTETPDNETKIDIVCSNSQFESFHELNDEIKQIYKISTLVEHVKNLMFIFEKCNIKFSNENIILNKYIKFNECRINVSVQHTKINEIYLKAQNFKNCNFESLSLSHSEVQVVYIDLNNIPNIMIQSVVIKGDFTIHSSTIYSITIKDVDFESLSEFNGVIFQDKFDFQEITCKGLTLFDKCVFNTKAQFEYIIFEKFTSFRGTTFNQGLNLDYTSGDKDINFFGIKGLESKESKANTSQETYRSIKHNFEKIGNKIDANKYHALELDQKRKELKKDKWNNKKEYIVFLLHHLSSEHSTNWFLVLCWIFFVGFATVLLLHGNIISDLWSSPEHFKREYIVKLFDQVLKFIYIGNMDDEFKSYPFIFLFNKVSLGYLYYQFITAVRKDTRK